MAFVLHVWPKCPWSQVFLVAKLFSLAFRALEKGNVFKFFFLNPKENSIELQKQSLKQITIIFRDVFSRWSISSFCCINFILKEMNKKAFHLFHQMVEISQFAKRKIVLKITLFILIRIRGDLFLPNYIQCTYTRINVSC